MTLAKLVPLAQFECNQDTVTIVQTKTDVWVVELDPSVAKQHDTFSLILPLLEELVEELDSWMAYFVNVGRLEVGMPIDRLALTELVMKEHGVLSEPSPREVWWIQITAHETIFPLEILPVHKWVTSPKYRSALISIYHRLASTTRVGLN